MVKDPAKKSLEEGIAERARIYDRAHFLFDRICQLKQKMPPEHSAFYASHYAALQSAEQEYNQIRAVLEQ